MEYICKTACFYKDQLFEVGSAYSTTDKEEKVPEHFAKVPAELKKKGKPGDPLEE